MFEGFAEKNKKKIVEGLQKDLETTARIIIPLLGPSSL